MSESTDLTVTPATGSIAKAAAVATADILLGSTPIISLSLLRPKRDKSLEQEKSELVAKLLAAGIEPLVFDALLSNEIDRRLKTRFGVAFVVLTFLFTSASYAIIVLNGPMALNISSQAITGLIIETPIQFVGLLYIIARNLFPDGKSGHPGAGVQATRARRSSRSKESKSR
jgi:hypothetical protein